MNPPYLEPGDRLRRRGTADVAEVVEVFDAKRIKVRWPDGSETWELEEDFELTTTDDQVGPRAWARMTERR